MTAARAQLDWSRSFGTVYGGGSIRYEQDNRCFDHQGLEVDEKGNPLFLTECPVAKQATANRKASSSEKLRNAAAERVRRFRDRRRKGVLYLVSVPVTAKLVAALAADDKLAAESAGDRQKIAAAVASVLEEWARG